MKSAPAILIAIICLQTSVPAAIAAHNQRPDLVARGDALTVSISPDIPDPHTILPPPQVEMDVVKLLAQFPKEERPYVQQVVHTVKELGELNKQCAKKAALFAEKGVPKPPAHERLDLATVTDFNESYLKYFDPLRQYMHWAYKRLYTVIPPPRFEKAHKYWLAYLAYALENLDHQRQTINSSGASRPEHSPVEVAQYRAWAYRLYKENGLDLTPYLNNQ